MRRYILAAAIVLLSATTAAAIANVEALQAEMMRRAYPLAPPPGKVVKINSVPCLLNTLYDTTAWCSGYGRTTVPPCFLPAIVSGELLCEDCV